MQILGHTANEISIFNINLSNSIAGENNEQNGVENTETNDLGMDYCPSGEKIEIKLTNKTNSHIERVLFYTTVETIDRRYVGKVRRPLYRPESGSDSSGMSDHLYPEETVARFFVNPDKRVPDVPRPSSRMNRNPVPILENYLRANREYLRILPKIEYRFRGDNEVRTELIWEAYYNIDLFPQIRNTSISDYVQNLNRINDNLIEAIEYDFHDDCYAGVDLDTFSECFFRGGRRPESNF